MAKIHQIQFWLGLNPPRPI